MTELYNDGYITDIADIFILKNHYQELITKERFGEKSVQNLLDAIEKVKITIWINLFWIRNSSCWRKGI